jgi:hypothetical protein
MNGVYLIFEFADAATLTDKANILRLMTGLQEAGWQYLKKAIVCDGVPGDKYVPADMLPQAWENAIRAAPRYGGGYWMEMEDARGFSLSFGYSPKELRRLFLAVDKLSIGASETNTRAFVSAAETIYNTLRPAYGYGLFNYDAHILPAIGAGIAAAWDYNFLGAALVDRFGRAALSEIPAWGVAVLDDGGMLIELSPNPVVQWRPYADAYKRAAAVFGVTQVNQGG